MIESFIVALALTGQCDCQEWYSPMAYEAIPVAEYWFGQWTKQTEFQADVFYGEKIRTVPIINGFVPEIRNRGGVIIYDYRNQIPYSKCKIPQVALRAPYIEPAPVAKVEVKPPPSKLKRPADIEEPQKSVIPSYRSKVSD